MEKYPRKITYEDMIRLAPKDGLILEFGVYKGNTLGQFSEILYQLGDLRTVYGFDSFKGLPEDWNEIHPKGRFATEPPDIAMNCRLVIGLFQETLEKFLEKNTQPVAFAHMDADLYSSTHYVLGLLTPRLMLGSILQFDEIQREQACEEHEQKAFLHFLRDSGQEWIYIGEQRGNTAAFMRVK